MSSDTPDFESIKQINPYGTEYWSARDLAPLLGYTKWERFDGAIQRAMIACTQVGEQVADHFPSTGKMVQLGSSAERRIEDYFLSRFACYLIAQNGDPRKREIAAAQAYFAIATRENELARLHDAQEKRLKLRRRVAENNRKLSEAAAEAGVGAQSFGRFHNAGYEGLYDGRDVAALKEQKGIAPAADILDHMGRAELAANDFRITQTEEKLRLEGIQGEQAAITTHHAVGRTVRKAIAEIGGRMPEDLPAEPSIKPLLDAQQRRRKKLVPPAASDSNTPEQGTLF